MNNRFAHCVSVNEATSLLCLFLSSEADDNDKQALNDEYDTFLAFAGEEDWQDENHSDPFHLIEQDAEELNAFLSSMDDLDGEPVRLNLHRTPVDDSLDWLDEVCGEDGELDEDATYSDPDNIAFLAMVKEHKENYGKSDSDLLPDDTSYRSMHPEDEEGYDYHESIDFKDQPEGGLAFSLAILDDHAHGRETEIPDDMEYNMDDPRYRKIYERGVEILNRIVESKTIDGNYPPGMTRCDLVHVGEIEPDDD